MNVEFTMKGEKELNAALSKLFHNLLPDALAVQLYKEAETIMMQSKLLVPVDTGALRATGKVDLPVITGTRVSVKLGYGDSAVTYAIPVHEIPPPPAQSPSGRSATHRPPTQWKYLEVPVLGSVKRITETLAKEAQKTIRTSKAQGNK